MSRRARETHDFDEILLETRAEAEEVLAKLGDMINRYDSVSLSDLYQLVGLTPTYTDEKWGWTNLEEASYSRVRNGGQPVYLLNLPRPEPLN